MSFVKPHVKPGTNGKLTKGYYKAAFWKCPNCLKEYTPQNRINHQKICTKARVGDGQGSRPIKDFFGSSKKPPVQNKDVSSKVSSQSLDCQDLQQQSDVEKQATLINSVGSTQDFDESILPNLDDVMNLADIAASSESKDDAPLRSDYRNLAWLDDDRYKWLEPLIKQVITSIKGSDRNGRTAACNKFKKISSECVCGPVHRSDWLNFLQLPPNPLMAKRFSSSSWQSKPTYFWIPEFFFWPIIRHMPCVNCGDVAGRVVSDGWNSRGPRRVSALGQEYDILCLRYLCKVCNTTFCGYDSRAVSFMPQCIQQQLPCVIYPKTALDNHLLVLSSSAVVKGISYNKVVALYEEVASTYYHRTLAGYIDFNIFGIRNPLALNAFHLKQMEDFGSIKDKSKWGLCLPTTAVLSKAYTERALRKYDDWRGTLSSTLGRQLSADHTFAIAKVIRHQGKQLFEACYTIMNEHGQVMAYYFTSSKSIKEIENELALVNSRYQRLQSPGPQILYIDNCCQDRQQLMKIFPSLKTPEGATSSAQRTIKLLRFEGRVEHIVDANNLKLAVAHINQHSVVGMDMEWKIDYVAGGTRNKVAVVQICTDEECYVISMFAFDGVPQELLQFFHSPIIKVGVNIKSDATNFFTDYDVQILHIEDLMDIYRNSVPSGLSLRNLCQVVLGRKMRKDEIQLQSDWTSAVLTHDQLAYAADDAYVSLLLYKAKDSYQPGQSYGTQISITSDSAALDGQQEIHQRILLDPFHIMDRYEAPKHHPLYGMFMSFLSDAFFINDPADIEKVQQYLLKKKVSSHDVEWLWKKYIKTGNVKRSIPQAAQLASRVDELIESFKQIGPGLITPKVVKAHANAMAHFMKGCVTDHPEVSLYTDVSKPGGELPKYRSARGSSAQEGYHRHLRQSIAATTMSPLLSELMILDVTIRWNKSMAESLGLVDIVSCHDLEILRTISELYNKNESLFSKAPLPSLYWNFDWEKNQLEAFGCLRSLNIPAVRKFFDEDKEFDLPVIEVQDEQQQNDSLVCIGHQQKPDDESTSHDILQIGLGNIPFPKDFASDEEVDIFLSLLKEYTSADCELDINELTSRFNHYVLLHHGDKLRQKSFAGVSLKTSAHISSFLSLLKKRSEGKQLLDGHLVNINSLRVALRTQHQIKFNAEVQRPQQIKRARADTNDISTDIESMQSLPAEPSVNLENIAVDNVSSPIQIHAISEADRLIQYNLERIETLIFDSRIQICAACLGIYKQLASDSGRMIFIGDHSNAYCPVVGREPNAEEKKRKDALIKRFKRQAAKDNMQR